MKSKQNITVFGATGKVGGLVISLLSAARIPAIAVTRNLSKAIDLPFIQWVEADMNDKESLPDTLRNSKSIFLISGASENMVKEQCNVIDIAVKKGVGHIVKLSSAVANAGSRLAIPKWHGLIEEHLKTSGISGTVLRPNGFMQNWLLGLAQSVKSQKKIFEAAGNGKRAYIDFRDIAEVAFKVLTEPEKHISHAYLLTGGEAIGYYELADLISEVIGDKVIYIQTSLENAKEQMEKRGMPGWAVENILSYVEDQRNDRATFVSNDVSDILQRPARTVAAFVKEYADQFR